MPRKSSSKTARLARWLPEITVFVSSFCVMVVELVAGRVISRHLGSSLYTWTSVIDLQSASTVSVFRTSPELRIGSDSLKVSAQATA